MFEADLERGAPAFTGRENFKAGGFPALGGQRQSTRDMCLRLNREKVRALAFGLGWNVEDDIAEKRVQFKQDLHSVFGVNEPDTRFRQFRKAIIKRRGSKRLGICQIRPPAYAHRGACRHVVFGQKYFPRWQRQDGIFPASFRNLSRSRMTIDP